MLPLAKWRATALIYVSIYEYVEFSPSVAATKTADRRATTAADLMEVFPPKAPRGPFHVNHV